MNRRLLIMALLLAGGVQGARADAPEDVVVARKAGMEAQSAQLAAITQGIIVNADIRQFAATGEAIAAWSKDIVDQFPPGTDGHGSEARPAVWSDRAGFEKAAAKLGEAAQVMAKAAASGDQADFMRTYRGTLLACAGCHVIYRSGRN
jgi:cytochrome c556